MERRARISEVRHNIFLLDDAGEATGYLVVGQEKACLIDTMNGEEDLKVIVQELTDKPVIIWNTHGHPDHIMGNMYFDNGAVNPKDMALCKSFTDDNEEFLQYAKEKNKKMPPFSALNDGDELNLGERTLVAYEIPGHSAGSMVFLLKEDRILFTGDAINHHLWMQLEECLSIEETVKSLDRIMFLESEADIILHGHATTEDDISLIRCMRDGMQELVDGNFDGDEPYHYFGGECKQHHFKLFPDKKYAQEHSVIVYNPENIHMKNN